MSCSNYMCILNNNLDASMLIHIIEANQKLSNLQQL